MALASVSAADRTLVADGSAAGTTAAIKPAKAGIKPAKAAIKKDDHLVNEACPGVPS